MDRGKPKVLIIDDDADFVETTRIVLESAQYDVISAGGMDQGTRRLEADIPDILILDMLMGGEGAGFLFARKVRKDPRFKDIPILMLTGMREQTGFFFPGKDKDPQFLPVDELIEKPLKPKDLLEKVAKLLEKTRAKDA